MCCLGLGIVHELKGNTAMRRWKKKSATWTVMFGLLAVGLTVYVAYGADANSMDRSGQGSSGMSDQGSSGMTGQGGGQAMPGHEMTGQGGTSTRLT